MPRPPVSLRRLTAPVLVLMLPAAVVMLGLTLAGQLRPGALVVALVVLAVLKAVLIRPYAADLIAIAQYVRELAGGEASPPALQRSDLGEEMLSAINVLRRSWRRKNEELQALLASTETLLDSLPDPLIMLDENLRVVRANLAARKVFARDLAGRDLSAVLRVPAVLEAADRIAAGQPGCDVEFSLPVPVEREFRARLEPLPGRAVDGTIAVLALHDMTAIKRMEQMRADFVANASHELRTPLATLIGFIETLRGPARDDTEARERFLGIMHEQASRMARLVQDLLSLSRIELNEHTQPMGRVDLLDILELVAETLALQARAKGMTLTLHLPDTLPPVLGQSDELTQVFLNLADNAIKYGHDNSPVEITARLLKQAPATMAQRLPAGAVLITVRDRSDGIAKEHLPRLTERFFRVDTARSRKLGGTGLGLAIVKHVVNRHRGVLTIDSTLGQGSVFSVYLPPARMAESLPRPASDSAA